MQKPHCLIEVAMYISPAVHSNFNQAFGGSRLPPQGAVPATLKALSAVNIGVHIAYICLQVGARQERRGFQGGYMGVKG